MENPFSEFISNVLVCGDFDLEVDECMICTGPECEGAEHGLSQPC